MMALSSRGRDGRFQGRDESIHVGIESRRGRKGVKWVVESFGRSIVMVVRRAARRLWTMQDAVSQQLDPGCWESRVSFFPCLAFGFEPCGE